MTSTASYMHTSKLAKKLARRMLFVYLMIYVCLLLVMCLLLFPIFYSMAVNQANSRAVQLHDAFKSMQSNSLQYVDGLANLPHLDELFTQYRTSPSEKNGALIEQYLQMYASTYNEILLIIVNDINGNILQSFNYRNAAASKLILNDGNLGALQSSPDSADYLAVSGNLFDDYHNSNDHFSSIAVSKNYKIGSEIYKISIFFKIDTFLSTAKGISGNNFSDYWVVRNGKVYYTTNEKKALRFIDTDLLPLHSSGKITIGNGLYFYNKIFDTDSIVVAYVSWSKLLSNFISIILIVTALYLLSPLLYSLFLTRTINRFLSPLKELSDTIISYSAGQVIDLNLKTGDELELLGDNFNKMMEKINMQIEDIKLFERENAVTQFRLLTTQIDPHFIYNTMNIINILARKGDTKGVVEVNSNLTYILQQRLNTKISIFETIEAEIKTLKQYQIIMDYRYANNVSIIYDIDQELLSAVILKNILQPLVENAYFHGLSNEEGMIFGGIYLSIRLQGTDIVITIKDDGRGIAPEKLEQMIHDEYQLRDPQKIHIGLHNIRQRLDYIYEDSYSMSISSTPNQGTTIVISFPMDGDMVR